MSVALNSSHSWVKNGFQGQNNVQNGSKQSVDVPRVFVKCVGVYNSDGSVGGVYYFFC